MDSVLLKYGAPSDTVEMKFTSQRFIQSNKGPMSAHNHDEELMSKFGNTRKGKVLNTKASFDRHEKLVELISSIDLSGLTKEEMKKKLMNAIDEGFDD